MAHFARPPFRLYEFDGAGLARLGGAPERRWFSGWNGLIGSPADDGSLGWAANGATVVVRTSGRLVDDVEAGFLAAHVALGGDELPLPRRPESAAATLREMANLRDTKGLWFEVPNVLAGTGPARAAVW